MAAKRPLLVIGIDGGEWKVIERLWAKNELPNLHALANRGVRTRLKTAYNSSPVIWTTIATGVIPKRHGITDFVVPTAQGDLPVSSGLRKVPAIWNMTTTGRRNAAVLGWWASWPAEPIRGVLVSDRILLDLPNRASPPEVLARFKTAQVAAEKETSLFGLEEESERRDRSMSYFARELLAKGDLDLMLLYFRSTDVVSHRAWKYFEPEAFDPIEPAELAANRERVPNVYRAVDLEIGKLLAIAPEANVLVISDHGFHATAREEETKVLLDLDAVLERLGYLKHKGAAVDFARTQVFSHASPNFRQARFVRFALTGRETQGTVRPDQRAALRDRLVEALRGVTYAGGEPVFFVRDARPKEIAEGADFVIGVSKAGASETLLVQGTPWKGAVSGIDRISGTHTTTTHGILIAAGPDIDPKADLAEIDVHDITPTLLFGLGLPVAEDFDGEAYSQLFREEFRRKHPLRKIKSWGVRKAGNGKASKADDQLLNDLRSLGYIQ
ncbi:MAG TPA: alkaline phosphatase family protein [Thermoanaerobaculia bacterium]|nr:alkaline phosphatase family protein [Thermoanaerobaculia bacterium]